jgi:hypothetical protein
VDFHIPEQYIQSVPVRDFIEFIQTSTLFISVLVKLVNWEIKVFTRTLCLRGVQHSKQFIEKVKK